MDRATEKKLLSAFNKYSGRTVLHPMATAICQTTEAIAAEAKSLGLTTRFLYDGQPCTDDHVPTRLNIDITKLRVSGFHLG